MKQKLLSYLDKYGFYLLPLIMVVVIVFLFFNYDLPLIEKLISLRRDNLNIQERLAGLSAKSNLLQELNFAQLQNDYGNLNYILPDGKDAPGILRTVDAAASASGITIVSLDLTPGILATESGKQSEIPIKVVVSGSISQITGFTGELTNLGRVLVIKTLDAVFEKTSPMVTASYEIRAFYLSPALANIVKLDDPLLEINPNENETLSRALRRSLLAPKTILLPQPKPDLFK